ncbi:hypothetical protein I6F10_05010 [Pseudoalteromonas sp. SWYJZ98]|uniref:hypothetical protein n=1 Tax=Pseudoalteromonas sp. SWYJZ98 TaxID=2792060 RepID=UPI0018CFEB42|nr:hypothetical protein [Pseudoalteromonas sp. SWYJZ98]MBH0030272.1 hypothetical protein [Pseudoalteromonas sp. SWYJZ98]
MDLLKLRKDIETGLSNILEGETLSKSLLEKTINTIFERVLDTHEQEKSKFFNVMAEDSKTIQKLDSEIAALELMISQEENLLNKMGE